MSRYWISLLSQSVASNMFCQRNRCRRDMARELDAPTKIAGDTLHLNDPREASSLLLLVPASWPCFRQRNGEERREKEREKFSHSNTAAGSSQSGRRFLAPVSRDERHDIGIRAFFQLPNKLGISNRYVIRTLCISELFACWKWPRGT